MSVWMYVSMHACSPSCACERMLICVLEYLSARARARVRE